MTPLFLGTINDRHNVVLDKPEQFKQYLHTFPTGKWVEVTVENLKHPRTNSQNRYYWGVVVKEIAQHTGHDPEQIHEALKIMFSPKWHFPNYKWGFPLADNMADSWTVPTSTTRLD